MNEAEKEASNIDRLRDLAVNIDGASQVSSFVQTNGWLDCFVVVQCTLLHTLGTLPMHALPPTAAGPKAMVAATRLCHRTGASKTNYICAVALVHMLC